MNDVVAFNNNVPAPKVTDERYSQKVAVMGIPYSRLSIKGMKFTMITPAGAGKSSKVGATMHMIILAREQEVNRTYFQGEYDENNPTPPDCFSRNGITPSPFAPKKQHTSCAECPMSIAGSGGENGTKACGYSLPIVAVPLNKDKMPAVRSPFYFRVNGNSIFGESIPAEMRFSFKELQPALQQINPDAPLSTFLIEASFDEQNDGMNKLVFRPVSYITQ
jgi:hypothetical protein